MTYTDSQKSEDNGEPILEYVNNVQNVLNQYNPYTRTFFKCSIYSPSNRLYTVDEVNSTLSDQELSSHFKFSNKNQDSMNMTNSIIIPMTPTPKISKVMQTRRIRTKTDKQDQKLNMTQLGPQTNPKSAKFLFKTVSSLPSNKSRDLGSPVIPLNSVFVRNNEPVVLTKKLENNKVIKLSAEKPKRVTPRKIKPGATRNVSSGDINKI